ncbi:alpha-N-arabinofuranosidase [Microbacterium trichothecenolyticum]|nr:alpha-L-arabinofuranosidase C-terminal domain-containing protein [Microbacterium trichothecenolyticum]MDR7187134.1 alpha-N-arabinofuranosidase [Microbacterium trichothecenolyticum]
MTSSSYTALVRFDAERRVSEIDRRLFGSFVEHLGRAVYNGIYEPGHPLADADGFRTDVIDLVRELGVTTVRYPGGNFVSSYRWEDGVGPRALRPRRPELAWHTIETNEVGLDEFARWATAADTEMMLAVNLGTRGIEAAVDLLDYANIRSGTTLSDTRAANGAPEPHDVRMWCLGNEMDGPWQVGYTDADSYGRLAAQTARAMRRLDEHLELVLCGSSKPDMPTFGAWERVALGHAYDVVDYISCHAYYEEHDGDRASFLASGVSMDRFIESVSATADQVKAELKHEKVMKISFDEWNVWYNRRFHREDKITDPQTWPYAPRLLEDRYSVVDAVVVGGLLISLLNHSDRVRAASLAQLVNVIAPIMTEPGGPSWRQTIFYPFADATRLSQRFALDVAVTSPTHSTSLYGEVDVIAASATWNDATGNASVFLVNRSTRPVDVAVESPVIAGGDVVSVTGIWDDDPDAANTLENPNRIVPRTNNTASVTGAGLSLTLPPISWTAVEIVR